MGDHRVICCASYASPLLGLCDKLNRFRQEGVLCDVIVAVQDRKFPCHRLVLAAFSDYFQKMFTIDMEERICREVCIREEIDPDAFEELLNFAYTGSLTLSESNALHILYAAHFLQVLYVVKASCEFLSHFITVDNFDTLYRIAQFAGLHEVLHAVNRFVVLKFWKIRASDQFLELAAPLFRNFLKFSDRLSNQEEEVFDCLLEWVKFDISGRKPLLATLARNVNIPNLSSSYIYDKILNEPLVKQDDRCISILLQRNNVELTADDDNFDELLLNSEARISS